MLVTFLTKSLLKVLWCHRICSVCLHRAPAVSAVLDSLIFKFILQPGAAVSSPSAIFGLLPIIAFSSANELNPT